MKFVLTFGSTHKVLKAESVLKSRDVPFRLDPAPKVLTSWCDLVVTVDEGWLDKALRVLDGDSEPSAVYKKSGDVYVKM